MKEEHKRGVNGEGKPILRLVEGCELAYTNCKFIITAFILFVKYIVK